MTENSESNIRPLPEIPLMPEEREEKTATKQPKLEGAPGKFYESALVADTLGVSLPGLEKVGREIERFSEILQAERHRNFIREKFNQFYNNPNSLEEYFDILRILQEGGTDQAEAAKLFSEILHIPSFSNSRELENGGIVVKLAACLLAEPIFWYY